MTSTFDELAPATTTSRSETEPPSDPKATAFLAAERGRLESFGLEDWDRSTAATGDLPGAPPGPALREDLFGVRLWCTGRILEVDRQAGRFRVELRDDQGNLSQADVDLEDVDPTERDSVVVGNRLTYVVFHEQRRTGLVNSDEIIVEPLRPWTEGDAARAAGRPPEDLSFLDDA